MWNTSRNYTFVQESLETRDHKHEVVKRVNRRFSRRHDDDNTLLTAQCRCSRCLRDQGNSHTSLSGVRDTFTAHTSNSKRVNRGSKYGVNWLKWCSIFFIINQRLKMLRMLNKLWFVFFFPLKILKSRPTFVQLTQSFRPHQYKSL